MTNGFILPHGGYRKLLSYQKSEIIFDATMYFTKRYFSKGDRTIDQMVQSARSGKQNIAEGSQASGTSKEMEVKLTHVARSSLEELLLDYQDFLRVRNLKQWDKDHMYVQRVRELNREPNCNYETFRKGIEHQNPEISANVIICLINIANYLLDKQIEKLQKDFTKHGGIRERMTKARLDERNKRPSERDR